MSQYFVPCEIMHVITQPFMFHSYAGRVLRCLITKSVMTGHQMHTVCLVSYYHDVRYVVVLIIYI